MTSDYSFNEIDFVKERILEFEKQMVDIDSILTEDDYAALLESGTEKANGKLTSHEDLKKELGL
jgi:hypothetical protein